MITESFRRTPYRLSASATPSPNDYMELGTQCEFLGIMTQIEMLATFFIHDGGDTAKWRLKGHGQKKFFEWLASSVSGCHARPIGIRIRQKPDLPPLNIQQITIETDRLTDCFLPWRSHWANAWRLGVTLLPCVARLRQAPMILTGRCWSGAT